MPCRSQTRSTMWPRPPRIASTSGWRPRSSGRSAKAMPLSVSTVWIRQGKTSTTDLAQEGGAVRLGVGVEGGDAGDLRDPVDRQEREQLAPRQAQLADADMD